MAQAAEALQAPGTLFVEDGCIGCMVCAEIAPETFLGTTNKDRVVVRRQPVGKEAISGCEEARELCPVNAIGWRSRTRSRSQK